MAPRQSAEKGRRFQAPGEAKVKASELREMTGDDLQARIKDRQDDIIHFRLQQATGIVDNVRLAREARREIARIKTILRERELSAAKGTQ